MGCGGSSTIDESASGGSGGSSAAASSSAASSTAAASDGGSSAKSAGPSTSSGESGGASSTTAAATGDSGGGSGATATATTADTGDRKESGGAAAIEVSDAVLSLPGVMERIADRYTFQQTLGKGASCRVVAASEAGKEESEFAIKIMSRERKVCEKLYCHEVKMLSLVHHEHIINLITHGYDEENFYVVTDLLTGGELFDRIVSKEYEISERKAASLVKQMLFALKECHDEDVVHRDLKPENFVFANPYVPHPDGSGTDADNKDDTLVLIDFGCAKKISLDEEYTDLVGTVYYLSPELAAQSSKLTITGRVLKASDMWSLGVIAYVMLTGRPPFGGRSNREIFTKIVTEPLRFPSDIELSKPFKKFVSKMLNKLPFKRYTVEDALKDPWITGESEASDAKLQNEVLRYLRQFNYQSKFKKAITKTLAKTMSEDTEKQVSKHFHRLDKDGDGHLDISEFEMLLYDLGYCPAEAKSEAKKMLEASDLNNDGTVDFEEFKAGWYRRLLSKSEKYVHMVFRVFDENGDGVIDAEELYTLLHDIGDMDYVLDLIKEIDTDMDNVISFEEFSAAMNEKVLPTSMDEAPVGTSPVLTDDLPVGAEVNEEEIDMLETEVDDAMATTAAALGD